MAGVAKVNAIPPPRCEHVLNCHKSNFLLYGQRLRDRGRDTSFALWPIVQAGLVGLKTARPISQLDEHSASSQLQPRID